MGSGCQKPIQPPAKYIIKTKPEKRGKMGKIRQQSINSRTEFFYYAFRNILLVSVPLLIVSSVVLFNLYIHSSATVSDSETDSLTLTLSTSCTLSSSLEEAHTASLNGGQYEEGIGITKVNTYCNDNNGYSIYAIGSSNNIDGNTDLISNINDNYNIHTGIYDSSSITASSPSSWSMKLTAGVGSGINTTPPTINNNYSNYNIVPSIYTLVASRASKTDMTIDTSVTGSYFTTTYDVYASSLQPAGTYTGKVKYLMVHPQSNNPYQANTIEESFAGAGKQKVYSSKAGGYYYSMQDMTANICNYVVGDGESTSAQLVDIRDGNIYWVTKLKDEHCWMTSNLDLSIGNTGPLNSNNTDISTTASGSGIYAAGYTEQDGVWTWNPVSTAITSNYYIDNTTVKPSAWPTNNTGHTTPYSLEGGDTYYYTSNTTGDDTRYNSLQACKNASHTEDECKRYFAGNYYNWSAAIASNNSTNIGSTTGEIAPNSICPKGWRLPNASQTDNVNNEFGRMLYQAEITTKVSAGNDSVGYTTGGLNKLRSNPYYFVRPGYIYGSTLDDAAASGSYWSSTVVNSNNAYFLSFRSSGVWPSNSYDRFFGRPVRCIAR